MKPVDRRLLRHARAARGYLAVVVVLGLVPVSYTHLTLPTILRV